MGVKSGICNFTWEKQKKTLKMCIKFYSLSAAQKMLVKKAYSIPFQKPFHSDVPNFPRPTYQMHDPILAQWFVDTVDILCQIY